MDTTKTTENEAGVITSAQLLEHWQGHRLLTRRVIEVFPEKELFDYSIGGMRPFAKMAFELLAIAVPGLRQIVTGENEELNEGLEGVENKEDMLRLWDESTVELNRYWAQIPDKRFDEDIVTFGQYPGTVRSSIQYFIDNEIHHRGQAYVYLRSLGIEPPYFWDR